MRSPWTVLRVSSLVAVAVTAGYLWRGALEDPARISRILPPEAFADSSQPPVIYVPHAAIPGPAAKPPAERDDEQRVVPPVVEAGIGAVGRLLQRVHRGHRAAE